MFVRSLSLKDFRCFGSLGVDFSPRVNVLYGENGSGKTNILEAIFTLCIGRSQRGATDTALVRVGTQGYRLEGEIETGGLLQEAEIAYQEGRRRRVRLNASEVKQAELFDRFCIVSSGPEDSNILSGGPSVRRLFLDLYLSQLSRSYLSDLSEYRRALSQKNAALKKEMDPTPFDPLVIEFGSRIIRRRGRFLSKLEQEAVQHYMAISEGESLQISYQPSVQCDAACNDQESIERAFDEALRENTYKESVLRTAVVGPHRDEISFSIGGLPARTHGSQGQWRTAAVALKLAVYELLAQKRKLRPVLLLDEIFAELDARRVSKLTELFDGTGQLFLTTAGEPPMQLPNDSRRFRLEDNQVKEIS